jgi:hypothetical protein
VTNDKREWCRHSLSEREVEVADGACPICLTDEVRRLRSELDRAKTALRAARARLVFIEKHSCENPPRCGYESSKTVALINEVLDAPTENKSNG